MVNSIALISSPFQLVCLKEYIFDSNIEDIEIVFINSSNTETVKKQVFLVAEFLDLKINKSFKNQNRFFYLRLFKEFFLKRVNNLILGSYFNSSFFVLSKLIKFTSLIFIDDGLATLFINKNHKIDNSLIGKYFKWDYGCFFSVFSNFKNQNISVLLKNNFNFLKSILNEKTIKNYSILLGGNFIESGLTSSYNYIKILNSISDRYEGEIIYIPHRLELPSNYKNYPFKILETDVCFEIFLIQLNSLPNNIFGFYTTALITSKNILSEYSKIDFINFNTNYFSTEIKVLFDEIFIDSLIRTEDL